MLSKGIDLLAIPFFTILECRQVVSVRTMDYNRDMFFKLLVDLSTQKVIS